MITLKHFIPETHASPASSPSKLTTEDTVEDDTSSTPASLVRTDSVVALGVPGDEVVHLHQVTGMLQLVTGLGAMLATRSKGHRY